MVKKRMVKDADMYAPTPTPTPTPRPRRTSSLVHDRVPIGIRINAGLLNQLRAMADDAGIISMNEYVCFVLRDHVKNNIAKG
jgi:hypothetical protein